MEDVRNKHVDTQCVHASFIPDEKGAVVTPIYQVSTFKFEDVDHGADLFAGKRKGYIYTRMANPTIESCEQAVAVLEGGYGGLGCASGMAAVHTVFMSMLGAGDHVICSDSVYGPTNTLLLTVMSRFGIEADIVDTSDLEAVEAAFRPNTKLVYVETPGNPTLVVTDLRAVADLAHDKGARVVVDNTFMSPVLQQPLSLGADVVLHSMTKFLNGHADVVAGMVVVKNEEDYSVFRKVLNQIGGVIDPFNSFLVSRGIKTLSLRMERACDNAMAVVDYLAGHEKVEKVHFPWHPSHPQHEIAKRQQKGSGAVISFELRGGIEAGKKLMNSIELYTLAVSLGGVESLIQHPASMTHASMGADVRRRAKITDGLVRIAVGIEKKEELIAALDRALAGI